MRISPIKLIMSIILFSCSIGVSRSEIIDSNTVAIYNNWLKGDSLKYECYSAKIDIVGNDTVVRESSESTTRLTLKEIMPDGDLIFESVTKAQPPEMDAEKAEFMRPFTETLMRIQNKPLLLRTDSLGVFKEIANYDDFKDDLDSCHRILQSWIKNIDFAEEQKSILSDTFEKQWLVAVSDITKGNSEMFNYYGNVYEIGTTSERMKQPIPMFDNAEIDMDIDFTCSVLKAEDDYEIVSLESFATYNSDQLFDLFNKKINIPALTGNKITIDPERPYISITQSEECMIDALSGTIMQIEREKRTIFPEKTHIDYSIIKGFSD